MSDPDKIPTPPVAPTEDAGSQALSEALKSSFMIVQVVMVVLVIAFFCSGIFTVGPQQRAMVLRLGRTVGEGEKALLNPGFHWAFPNPIDEVVTIPFTALQTADSSVGWFQTADERRSNAPKPMPQPQLNPASTSYAITADTNIIHVAATVRYRITDPIHYYFDFANAAVFVTNALDNSLLYAASQFSIDDILTKNRSGFREAVTERLRQLLDQEKLGITIDSQLGMDVSPPLALVERFDAVDAANVSADRLRSQAEAYAAKKIAEANGTAATRVDVARAEKSRLVSMVGAEAKKFSDVRAEYERNPDLYQHVAQMFSLQKVYQNAQEKIIEPHLNQRELRVNLGPEPRAPSTNSVAP